MGKDWKSLRVPQATHDKIVEIAESEGTTYYGVVSELVDSYHDLLDAPEPEPQVSTANRKISVSDSDTNKTDSTNFKL